MYRAVLAVVSRILIFLKRSYSPMGWNFTLRVVLRHHGAITTLAAHAVIREGLINMFWFRELLTNNCMQPRVANGTEGQTETFSPH